MWKECTIGTPELETDLRSCFLIKRLQKKLKNKNLKNQPRIKKKLNYFFAQTMLRMFNFNTFMEKLNNFSKNQQNVMKTQPISPKTQQNFPKP